MHRYTQFYPFRAQDLLLQIISSPSLIIILTFLFSNQDRWIRNESAAGQRQVAARLKTASGRRGSKKWQSQEWAGRIGCQSTGVTAHVRMRAIHLIAALFIVDRAGVQGFSRVDFSPMLVKKREKFLQPFICVFYWWAMNFIWGGGPSIIYLGVV